MHRDGRWSGWMVALGTAWLAGASPAAAQADSAPADSARVRTLTVRAAVGTTLAGYSRIERGMPALGVLGLQWQRPGSRLSSRLEASYQRHESWSARFFSAGCGDGCRMEEHERLAAITLDGQYDLLRSAVRPYILSGFGIYHVTSRHRRNFFCEGSWPDETCTTSPQMLLYSEANDLRVGLHAGAGVGVTIGRATLFGEARYSLLSGDWNAGSRIPLLIGVRF